MFIPYLTFSHASLLECVSQLETIQVIYKEHQEQAKELILKYNNLGKKINNFTVYVETNWKV